MKPFKERAEIRSLSQFKTFNLASLFCLDLCVNFKLYTQCHRNNKCLYISMHDILQLNAV